MMGLSDGQASAFRREDVLYSMRAFDADGAQQRAATLQAPAHGKGMPLTYLLRD